MSGNRIPKQPAAAGVTIPASDYAILMQEKQNAAVLRERLLRSADLMTSILQSLVLNHGVPANVANDSDRHFRASLGIEVPQ